jgi:polyphosphate kinase
MAEPQTERYFHRESSWLEFNARVLAEAMDPSNLLFDRLKFIGIVSSNFDEFFMVRLPALETNPALEGAVRRRACELMDAQNRYFSEVLVSDFERANIFRVSPQALNEAQFEFVKSLFLKELFPVLTPIALFEDKVPPILVNLSPYMVFGLAPLASRETPLQYAVVEIPRNFPRMISLPSPKGYQFMLIENLIALFAKDLFLGYEIVSQGLMRITRAAGLTLDEESEEDFSRVMSAALRKRRQSYVVRVETAMDPEMEGFLVKKLDVTPEKIYRVRSWFDLKTISQFAYQPLFQDLRRPVWDPRPVPEFEKPEDCWNVLKQRDVWVHHPYQSFEAVHQFLAAAATDPDVLAIKQTLYRIGQDSEIVRYLELAAEAGKRVTVLVELKARFDEEKNITWAHRLEDAGASVIYGVAGLKTHAKICLVVRREPEGIKRYVHLSTGNYNEKTAELYSDIGYFTGDEKLANDATIFFNMVTGFSQPMTLSKLIVAPFGLRRRLKRLIHREALRATDRERGFILAKMNSLVDEEIIEALYAASGAGVQIKLHVRGICRLRPGIKGLSENIEVTSTVDMFLEHSRVFYFYNGGDDEIYLSSADWMPRNLDRRIEIMFPVENPQRKNEILEVLKLYFRDNVKSWRLDPNGNYEKIEGAPGKRFRVQEHLCQRALEEEAHSKKAVPQELKPQKPVPKDKILNRTS